MFVVWVKCVVWKFVGIVVDLECIDFVVGNGCGRGGEQDEWEDQWEYGEGVFYVWFVIIVFV